MPKKVSASAVGKQLNPRRSSISEKTKANVAFLFGAGVEREFELPLGFEFGYSGLYSRIDLTPICEKFNGLKFGSGTLSISKEDQNSFEDMVWSKTLGLKSNDDLFEERKALAISNMKKMDNQTPFESDCEEDRLFRLAKEYFLFGESGHECFSKYIDKNWPNEREKDFENQREEIQRCFSSVSYVSSGKCDSPYSEDFCKLFLFYWKSYFAVVAPLLKRFATYLQRKETTPRSGGRLISKWYNVDEKDCYKAIKVKEIINDICGFTDFLYKYAIQGLVEIEDNVYDLIGQTLFSEGSHYASIGAITTNYSNLSSRIRPSKKGANCVFLNGDFKHFQYSSYGIFSAREEKPTKMENVAFFPFIFGQTMVKPIYNDWQIREFERALRVVEQSNYLVTYGHSLSPDDVWIFSLLKHFVDRKGAKCLLIVSDNQSKERIIGSDNFAYFKDHSKVRFIDVDYSQEDREVKAVVNKILCELNKLEGVR